MIWSHRIPYYALIVGLSLFFSNCDRTGSSQGSFREEGARSLIEIEDLQNLQGTAADLILIDVRPLEEYSKGHIPQAFQVWRSDIQNQNYPYGGMMASKQKIASLLGSIGATPNHHIVLYDNNGCVDAARLWWILSYYGHKNTALLNGGLTAWEQEGNRISRVEPVKKPLKYIFSPSTDESGMATMRDVKNGINDPNTLLLDTRTSEEYSGANLKTGASRPGRIPGSIWADWVLAIDYGESNKFKTNEELRVLYESKGITPHHTIIAYCHSGVRSAHTTFVLTELLGYPNVLNYDGSWTEWSYHSELPVETDPVKVM